MGRPALDLTGRRYGKLVVIRRADDYVDRKGHKSPVWECKCDCGNTKNIYASKLKSGKVTDCGCEDSTKRNEKGQFVKGQGINDISGKKFGKLTVIRLDKIVNKKSYWYVKCECGNVKSVRSDTLKKITSCGCDKKKQDLINLHVTNNHELTHHPVYHIWSAMLNRCYSPKNTAYKDYGGRGITVCEEWKDIRNFAKWADESGFVPDKNLSIERVDVNGNYCPENCIWIDKKLQARNKRNTIRFTIEGVEKSLSEWSEIYGISHEKVIGRYYRGVRNPEDLFYKGNLQMRNLGRE